MRAISPNSKDFCVYFHINPLFNHIFYVGMGKDKRPYSKQQRSVWWKGTVGKYGYVVDIAENNLTRDEAVERERFYINKIGRKDLGKGTLINMTNGGDGGYGFLVSEETKLKMSKKHTGRKFTEEHKRKLALSKIGKPRDQETRKKIAEFFTGKKRPPHSEETKQKMRISGLRRYGKLK